MQEHLDEFEDRARGEDWCLYEVRTVSVRGKSKVRGKVKVLLKENISLELDTVNHLQFRAPMEQYVRKKPFRSSLSAESIIVF